MLFFQYVQKVSNTLSSILINKELSELVNENIINLVKRKLIYTCDPIMPRL